MDPIQQAQYLRQPVFHEPLYPRKSATGGGSGFPWDKLAFGFVIDGANVEINGGYVVEHGPDGAENHGTTGGTITAGSNTKVWVAWAFEGDVTIGSGSSIPVDDETHAYFHLYTFTTTAGQAVLQEVRHMGDIHVVPKQAP